MKYENPSDDEPDFHREWSDCLGRCRTLEHLIQDAIYVLNQIPNTRVSHPLFDKTYPFISHLEAMLADDSHR